MPHVSFQLDDTRVQKRLSDIAGGVKDLSKPFNEAGDELLTYFGDEVFSTQGAALGESWRALAASTLLAREKRRGHYAKPPITTGKILIWTGRLKSGFEKQTKKTLLRIFNSVPYFKFHQRASGLPPQRRMLAINKEVITTVMRHVSRYVERKMG